MNNQLSPDTIIYIIEISSVVLIFASFVISVMFILTQQKLNNVLAEKNEVPKIHGVWFWTQLLPLWSYIALIVVAIKLDEQIKKYQNNYYKNLKFKRVTVYWYVGFTVLNFIPVINILTTILSMILFIIIWSNMSKTTKQILGENIN